VSSEFSAKIDEAAKKFFKEAKDKPWAKKLKSLA
jgi:hypothetical protein